MINGQGTNDIFFFTKLLISVKNNYSHTVPHNLLGLGIIKYRILISVSESKFFAQPHNNSNSLFCSLALLVTWAWDGYFSFGLQP